MAEFYYQRQVSFIEAIKMAFNNYCNFSGRASRAEYWWFYLFTMLLNWVVNLCVGDPVDMALMSHGTAVNFFTTGNIIIGAVSLALLLPSLGLLVRRLHDTGHSGWWVFISLVPLVGWILLLVWLCKGSQMQPNQYGPVPDMASRPV